MSSKVSTLMFSLVTLIPNSSLCAATTKAGRLTGDVSNIDFSTGAITLASPKGCQAPNSLMFNDETRFVDQYNNDVDSSILVVTKKLAADCPTANRATVIVITETSYDNPPTVSKDLGKFPLFQIIGALGDIGDQDRFSKIEGKPDFNGGVAARRLATPYTFSPGKLQGYCISRTYTM